MDLCMVCVFTHVYTHISVQFSLVTQSCPALCNPVCRLQSLEGMISCRNQCPEKGSDCPRHRASKQPGWDENS